MDTPIAMIETAKYGKCINSLGQVLIGTGDYLQFHRLHYMEQSS